MFEEVREEAVGGEGRDNAPEKQVKTQGKDNSIDKEIKNQRQRETYQQVKGFLKKMQLQAKKTQRKEWKTITPKDREREKERERDWAMKRELQRRNKGNSLREKTQNTFTECVSVGYVMFMLGNVLTTLMTRGEGHETCLFKVLRFLFQMINTSGDPG